MNSTDTERQPVLNKVALWSAVPNDQLSVRIYTANRTYSSNGVIRVASPSTPLHRYVKAYERFKVRFSVFLFSESDDRDAVEKFMDSIAKGVKKEDVNEAFLKSTESSFKYLDKYFKENK